MVDTMETGKNETYNGWKNYPTWSVNLWLSNDEGLYNAAKIIAENVESDPEDLLPRTRRRLVADAYKDWVTNELAPDLGASFAADLLGYALDQVDWLEIADAWLEDLD